MILAYQDAFSEVVDGVTDADFVIDVEVDVKGSSRESWFILLLMLKLMLREALGKAGLRNNLPLLCHNFELAFLKLVVIL